jgi:peroxiredoxin
MKGLTVLLFFISAILFYSCNKAETYKITGELTGFPDSTMLYLTNLSTEEKFDSALIIKGRFVFIGKLDDTPEQIWLNTQVDKQFIYANLLIGNEVVKVRGDIKDFPWDVKITGSKTQDDNNYLQDLLKQNSIKRDSLVQTFFNMSSESQQKQGKEIWDKINSLDKERHAIQLNYTKSYINTYPGIINLGYLKNSLPKDTIQALYNKLSPEIKSSKYAKIVEIFLKEKISEIGDPYHEFEAFNKYGDKIKFSKLTGKFILLDFTAAYCGPCLQSAEELRFINKAYSDSLVIVSFSGDSKKDTWLKSLDRDSVSWISLWDGKGTFSETYIKYGVQGLPSFYLIDPNGKIIDKWDGYGKGSLESKLRRFKNI